MWYMEILLFYIFVLQYSWTIRPMWTCVNLDMKSLPSHLHFELTSLSKIVPNFISKTHKLSVEIWTDCFLEWGSSLDWLLGSKAHQTRHWNNDYLQLASRRRWEHEQNRQPRFCESGSAAHLPRLEDDKSSSSSKELGTLAQRTCAWDLTFT